MLQFDGVTLPADTIAGFASTKTIDLHGISFNGGDTPNYTSATGELDIINSGNTVASLFFGAGNTQLAGLFHLAQETSGTGIVVTNNHPASVRAR